MHDHSHHHHHHDGASGRIATAFALNLVFTVIEFIGGVLTNSTAILADAVHDLGDTLAIALGWLLQRLGGRPASRHFTYGYQRLSLLGALINALILLAGSAWVLSEAIPRLQDPPMPHAAGMTGLAVLGVLVNGVAAWKLSGGQTLNEKVLNWHLLEDVLGWVAVLIVSIVLQFAHWPILDPLLSIVFTLFILINVLRNLGTTLRLFLQATPDVEMNQDILQRLSTLPHVTEVHHLHLWSLDGEHHVLTAHLVLDIPIDSAAHERIKQSIRDACEGCDISHTTIELEQLDEQCRDR
jgi:cobalt-zinc-cadmium efflux system protein